MENDGLNPCRKSSCWIPTLLDKGYVALWPHNYARLQKHGFYAWNFSVQWTPKTRARKVNHVLLCEKHHKQVLALLERSIQADVREMEVTDAWLTRTNSRM